MKVTIQAARVVYGHTVKSVSNWRHMFGRDRRVLCNCGWSAKAHDPLGIRMEELHADHVAQVLAEAGLLRGGGS